MWLLHSTVQISTLAVNRQVWLQRHHSCICTASVLLNTFYLLLPGKVIRDCLGCLLLDFFLHGFFFWKVYFQVVLSTENWIICSKSGWILIEKKKNLDTFFLNLLKALKWIYLPISKGDGAEKRFPEITRIRFQLPDPFGSYLSQVPQSKHRTTFRGKPKLFQSLSHVSNSKLWEGYKKVPCGQSQDQCYCSSV